MQCRSISMHIHNSYELAQAHFRLCFYSVCSNCSWNLCFVGSKVWKKEERRCRVCVFIRHEREVTFQWASKMKWICRLWGFSAKGIESAQKNHQVNYVKLLVKNKNVMNSNNVNGRSNLIWNWTNWTTIVSPNHTSLGFIVNISTHKLKQTNSQIYCKCWLWMASWHWSLIIQQTWNAIATNWVRLRSSL